MSRRFKIIALAKSDQVSTDHIVHHTLTLYALGATPEQIQGHYDHNKSYQRLPEPVDDSVIKHLHDVSQFHEYLGNGRYYHDYLIFFQSEIDKKGYENVINEYLLKGDDRADDMLCRLYAGKPYNGFPYPGSGWLIDAQASSIQSFISASASNSSSRPSSLKLSHKPLFTATI